MLEPRLQVEILRLHFGEGQSRRAITRQLAGRISSSRPPSIAGRNLARCSPSRYRSSGATFDVATSAGIAMHVQPDLDTGQRPTATVRQSRFEDNQQTGFVMLFGDAKKMVSGIVTELKGS